MTGGKLSWDNGIGIPIAVVARLSWSGGASEVFAKVATQG